MLVSIEREGKTRTPNKSHEVAIGTAGLLECLLSRPAKLRVLELLGGLDLVTVASKETTEVVLKVDPLCLAPKPQRCIDARIWSPGGSWPDQAGRVHVEPEVREF